MSKSRTLRVFALVPRVGALAWIPVAGAVVPRLAEARPASYATGTSSGTVTTAGPADEGEHGASEGGLFGPLRLGPLVAGGLSTRPLDFELMFKIDKWAALGAVYGMLPTVHVSDASINAYQIAGDVRIFPFGSAFFLGATAGYQSLTGWAQWSGQVQSLGVDSPFVTPRIGFLETLRFGLTFGLDVGVAIPFNVKETTNAVYVSKDVQDAVDLLAKSPTPDIKVRLGYLF